VPERNKREAEDDEGQSKEHGRSVSAQPEFAKTSVCPEMGTEIQIGPTGQKLLPLSVV
jgi:hypothetical protein